MRIEAQPKSLKPTQQQSTVDLSWKHFFAQFSTPPSKEQQEEIIQNLMQHLSHIIHQNMQRMINIYKQMNK